MGGEKGRKDGWGYKKIESSTDQSKKEIWGFWGIVGLPMVVGGVMHKKRSWE